MRRVVLLGAFVVMGHGCRCNTVTDKDLPVAAPATAPAPAPVASAGPATIDCGPDIAGTDDLANASAILLGELHGLRATPIFAVDLACRLARQLTDKTVTLALELPGDEQARIDAFMASPGKTADRAALLGGGFWTGSHDGRSSEARVEMIDQARRLSQGGVKIRILTIDGPASVRDEAMAKNVIAAVEQKRGPVLVLVGNLHAGTQPSGNQRWMGEYIREKIPNVIALDNRYGPGEAWICTGTCGVQKVTGQDPEGDSKWRIEKLPARDAKGFSGVWHIGPARPSLPAVPAK